MPGTVSFVTLPCAAAGTAAIASMSKTDRTVFMCASKSSILCGAAPTSQCMMTTVMTLVLLAMAFASGAASLIYQIVWMRRLALVFGNTTLATSTVLAAFLAGLAIGTVLWGRWADR